MPIGMRNVNRLTGIDFVLVARRPLALFLLYAFGTFSGCSSTLIHTLIDGNKRRDNKTMNRSGGFLRFWDGESNPATRLS